MTERVTWSDGEAAAAKAGGWSADSVPPAAYSVEWVLPSGRTMIRPWVGRRVNANAWRDMIERDLRFYVDSLWHLQGVPASEHDGLDIFVGGRLVGRLSTKGVTFVDEADPFPFVDWSWAGGHGYEATVADMLADWSDDG